MADREPGDRLLVEVSAALDGEGTMPEPLDAEAARFAADARRVRAALRVEEAAVPPDVTAAVLARIGASEQSGPTRRRRRDGRPALLRRTPVAAAAAFVLAALVAAVAVRPGGLVGPEVALADIGDQVLADQVDVRALDADLHLVERGAHPEVPERHYRGTLRYRAPEQLSLRLDERGTRPDGWPANDLELAIHDGTAWSRGLQDCPVAEQPGCLGTAQVRVIDGLAPFSSDWVAPLDLVVPAAAFLPAPAIPDGTTGQTRSAGPVVESSVARLQRVVDALRSAGAVRSVHPTDAVRLELDPDSSTIRRLTIRAGDTRARALWAASNGYQDEPGTAVLDLRVTPRDRPGATEASPPPATAASDLIDAHFLDADEPTDPVTGRATQPEWLPPGFAPHRAGVLAGAGPRTTVRSWSNGRAWIRVDATTGWEPDRLFGGLGPLVRPVAAGDGVAHVDPQGLAVALRTREVDVVVTGSVPTDVLVSVAGSLPVAGEPVPTAWPQGEVLDVLPDGALAPPGPLLARHVDGELLVAVPGPGSTGVVLAQRPGLDLGPASKADLIEVAVRGTTGRWAPRLGTLTWVEGGWVRELRGDALDVAHLLAIADALEER